MKDGGNNDDARSWGELIKSVEKQKRNKQMPSDHPEYNRIEKKVVQSNMNPVAMTFNDENKEREYVAMKLKKEMDKCSKDLDLKNQRFNVINHEGPPRNPIPVKRNVNGRQDRDWRLLSQVSEQDHKELSIFYDESIMEKQKKLATLNIQSGAKPRVFNILSNSYIQDDESKKGKEDKVMKEHISKQYWKSHNFDFLHGEYYDYNKEQQQKQNEIQLAKDKTYRHIASMPPSTLSSEGKNYNIITQQDWSNKNELIKSNSASLLRDRSLERLRHTNEIIQDMKQRGDMQSNIHDSRKIHRINHSRWENDINRDFNIINNTIKQTTFLPQVQAPVPVWEKLQQGGSSSGNNHNSITGCSSSSSSSRMQTQRDTNYNPINGQQNIYTTTNTTATAPNSYLNSSRQAVQSSGRSVMDSSRFPNNNTNTTNNNINTLPPQSLSNPTYEMNNSNSNTNRPKLNNIPTLSF